MHRPLAALRLGQTGGSSRSTLYLRPLAVLLLAGCASSSTYVDADFRTVSTPAPVTAFTADEVQEITLVRLREDGGENYRFVLRADRTAEYVGRRDTPVLGRYVARLPAQRFDSLARLLARWKLWRFGGRLWQGRYSGGSAYGVSVRTPREVVPVVYVFSPPHYHLVELHRALDSVVHTLPWRAASLGARGGAPRAVADSGESAQGRALPVAPRASTPAPAAVQGPFTAGEIQEIRLHRGAGAPDYDVALRSDGRAVYHARAGVPFAGRYEAPLPRATFDSLAAQFVRAKVWTLRGTKIRCIDFCPNTRLEIRTARGEFSVRRFWGESPVELQPLEQLVDSVVAHLPWTWTAPCRRGGQARYGVMEC